MSFRWTVPIAAVLMAAGFLSVFVYADDSEGVNDNFTWERDGDDVTVRGYGDLQYDSGWNGLKNLTVIPEGGVVSFSTGIFFEHISLETVTVQGSVGSIGHNAFSFCDTLTTLTIWGSVGYVGEAAIHSCDGLTTVTIAGTIGSFYSDFSLSGSSVKTVNLGCTMDVSPGDTDYGCIAEYADVVNKIHSYSASYDWADDGSACTVNIACTHGDTENHQEHPEVAHTVKIPPATFEMGTTEYSVSGTYDGFAYSDTKDVKDIPAPNQCGDHLYWSMDSDKCVTFTGSGDMWNYTSADELGWKDCTSVILQNGVTSIGNYAFYECTSLGSVTIPDSVTSIGNNAFSICGLGSVTIPDSVTSIGNYVFFECTSLASVTIPDSVTSIGNGAFNGCTSLASVTIPDSVTSIGNFAFCECTSLASVTITDSVISIGDGAFYGCVALTTVTIQGSIDSIGELAFESCSKLETLTITGPITSIETDAFTGCSNLKTVNIACNDPLNITVHSANNGRIAYYADTVNHVHRYSAVYGWADDGKSCTVHINCLNDSALIHDDHPEVSHTVKIQPTETTMGTTEYSVSGTYDGFAYSDTKDVQDIPATGGSGDGKKDNTLLYIATGGAIAAIALIGAAFFLLRRP